MQDEPSRRLIDQRIRNRIMEAIATLAEGDEGVRAVGPHEYFESFYDWVPHRDEDRPAASVAALSPAEREAVVEVSCILDDACDATPRRMTVEAFTATGWPARIQPVARKAFDLMRERGRFSEDREEEVPSG